MSKPFDSTGDEAAWILEKVRQEAELGEFPPGGATGGVIAKARRRANEAALEPAMGSNRDASNTPRTPTSRAESPFFPHPSELEVADGTAWMRTHAVAHSTATFSWVLTMTGVGTKTAVRCSCGLEHDATDYASW